MALLSSGLIQKDGDLTSDRESWAWKSDLAAQILLHRTSGSYFSEVKRRMLCCWDFLTLVMSKASGRLLPVFCDGLPQFAQDPTSVRTQLAWMLATVDCMQMW